MSEADLNHPNTEVGEKNVLVPNLIAASIFAAVVLVLPGPILITKIFDNDRIAVPLGIMMASGPLLIGLWHLCLNLVKMWYYWWYPEEKREYLSAALWGLLWCAAFGVVLGIAATVVAMLGSRSWWLYDTTGLWFVPLGVVPVVAYATVLYRLLIAKSMGWTILWAGISLFAVWYLASEAARIAYPK